MSNKENKPCLREPISQKQGDGQDDLDQQMTLTSLCGKLRQGCLDRKTSALLSTRPRTNATGKGQLRCHYNVLPDKGGGQMSLAWGPWVVDSWIVRGERKLEEQILPSS